MLFQYSINNLADSNELITATYKLCKDIGIKKYFHKPYFSAI